MRDEVLMSLVDRASGDARFRRRAREDLDGTLREYGYELTPEELGAVREFHARTVGMSEEELDGILVSGSRSRQFGG